jgi:hypothetical protein
MIVLVRGRRSERLARDRSPRRGDRNAREVRVSGPRRDEDKAGPRRDDPVIRPVSPAPNWIVRSRASCARCLVASPTWWLNTLVASGRFIDDDPELAYQHAKTARRLAARLGGVREAVAVTAYLAEHYDEALTEFRAVRRMTGNHEVLR